ncbi:MAG: gamma-glutamyl-gamma-aminobutyrate hydrolase family protein [Ardenticatenaceae bacterium]|nr:gamma-glutamyl-gamma-aminobutyrate hydrolase family protein [Ardenticatenaceae bacterium]MCB9443630.1 gamma-glutamyl-gamma-aminobutyrate hydrolase family protein [Ardenticatenaceae bacterium]
MFSFAQSVSGKRPLIGLTTYRKMADQFPPIEIIGLMPSYIESIVAAGGLPVLIPLGLGDGELTEILTRVDGVLLPGGGDIEPSVYGAGAHETMYGIDSDRDRVEIVVARQAVKMQKPLLAICRGHQVLNVALGGTLWEDVQTFMPHAIRHDNYRKLPRNYIAHSVTAVPDSQIAALMGKTEINVNSLHHQGVRDLAPELRATAVAPDGLVEGIEIPGHPFAVSVQWHPENLIHDDPTMLSLFKGLVEAAMVNAQ